MTWRSGGEAVVQTLLAWGVRQVFTCPGSTEAAFLDATLDHPDLRVVLTPHEAIAVSAADGYARASGDPAVAYLHTHVGLANGLSHLYAARLAHSPVVVLTGLKPAVIQAHDGFTSIPDTGQLARPFVKWHWQTLTAAGIPEDLNRALRLATTEPTGPTWLGLPQDLLDQDCDSEPPDPRRYRQRARTAPDPARLRAAVELLSAARRPVLVAGAEVARHRAVAELAELAERLRAPVFNEDRRTYERPGFPSDHPSYAGLYDVRRASVRDSDLVVFIGCRCFHEFEVPSRPEVPPGARIVHTHTDPTAIGAIYGVDVDLVGDERAVLSQFLAALPGGAGTGDGDWLQAARAELAGGVTGAATPPAGRGGFTTVAAASAALAAVVGADTTVVGDATTSGAALLRDLPQAPPHQFYTSRSGSLGWGMGAAIGLKLALPEREVIAVEGDGAFQFGPQALWVAAHYQVPVTFVVLNNQSYAAVAAALRRYGGRAVERGEFPGKDLSGVDVAAVARGYGVAAERVCDAADLGPAIDRARRHRGPSLIEVMTDPSDLGP
jgi:benzoylformate decarboxylase